MNEHEIDWKAMAQRTAESQAQTIHALLMLKPHGDEWRVDGIRVHAKDVSVNAYAWTVSWLDLAPEGQVREMRTVRLDTASFGAVTSVAFALRSMLREAEEKAS